MMQVSAEGNSRAVATPSGLTAKVILSGDMCMGCVNLRAKFRKSPKMITTGFGAESALGGSVAARFEVAGPPELFEKPFTSSSDFGKDCPLSKAAAAI